MSRHCSSGSRLTNRWSGRLKDKVPSSYAGARRSAQTLGIGKKWPMTKYLLACVLLVLPILGFACDKEPAAHHPSESIESMKARTVFNRITKQSREIDAALMAGYGCKYIFANVADTPALTRPSPTQGSLLSKLLDENGNRIVGRVMIGYIVSIDGLVVDPIVIESTDPRLTEAALKSMKAWRFAPAAFNGKSVATLAAQEFSFTDVKADV